MENYLIACDSYKLVKEQVDKITGDSLNVIKYDLRINTLNEVINEANYFSLLNEQKYIIVHADNLLKASKKEEKKEDASDDAKLLENYFKNPNDKCSLIFISYEMPDKRKKIYKLFMDKGHVIINEPLNKKDLTYKCIDLLKDKGFAVDYETANYIVENSYVNYDILTNELEKIYSLLTPQKIVIDDLKDIISISITNTSFEFINAIINRDLKRAVESSKNFERLKIEPAMIIVMLAKEFQIMNLLLNGMNKKEVQYMFHKEDWQMKNYLVNVEKYTKNEIKKAIIKLADYDYKYKSGLLDKSVIIELLTLDFCS
ncbi:MAG: DNA polymerase III subunit delta [Bacilli bacterium]|nr:DNA polymerase III subunit delta [Bacilli bacterium]